jgi:hypothetical protein
MSEPAGTARRVGQHINLHKPSLLDPAQNQLGNAIASLNSKRFIAEIKENNPDLAPVIGIDGAGRIQEADSVLKGQSASRPHLAFIPFGYRYSHTRGNQFPGARGKDRFRINGGREVDSRRVLGLIMRNREAFGVFKLGYMYEDMLRHFLFKKTTGAAVKSDIQD